MTITSEIALNTSVLPSHSWKVKTALTLHGTFAAAWQPVLAVLDLMLATTENRCLLTLVVAEALAACKTWS